MANIEGVPRGQGKAMGSDAAFTRSRRQPQRSSARIASRRGNGRQPAARSRADCDPLDLDRSRHRIAVGLQRLQIDLDRFSDHLKRLLARVALARAARERRDGDAETPALFSRQHNLVFAWRDHRCEVYAGPGHLSSNCVSILSTPASSAAARSASSRSST